MMDNLDTARLQTLPVATAPATRPATSSEGKPLPSAGETVPAADTQAPAPVENIDLSGVVQQIESYLSSSQRSLNFRVDEASGRQVITVVNPENGEVIRQIPSEEALRMAASLSAGNTGLIDTLA